MEFSTVTSLLAYSATNNASESNLSLLIGVRICEAANLVLFILTLWILCCMIEYGRRFKKWNIRTKKGKIYTSCFAAVAIGTPRFVVDWIMIHATGGDRICEILADFSNRFHCISIISVHLYLWLRQKAVHDNNQIQVLMPTWVKAISYFVLIMTILTNLSFAIIMIYPKWYFMTDVSCGSNHLQISSEASLAIFMMLITTILQQTGPIWLFVYPIIRLRMKKPSQNTGQIGNQDDKLSSTVRRCLLWTVVVIFTDIVSGIFIVFPIFPPLVSFYRLVLNTDVMINHFCLLATYRKCGRILTVFFYREDQIQQRNPANERGPSP